MIFLGIYTFYSKYDDQVALYHVERLRHVQIKSISLGFYACVHIGHRFQIIYLRILYTYNNRDYLLKLTGI